MSCRGFVGTGRKRLQARVSARWGRVGVTPSPCSRPAWCASARRATHSWRWRTAPGVRPGRRGRPARWRVGLAGAGRPEEDHVLLRGDEVERAQVGDGVAFEGAGVVEIELFQRLAGGEAGGADAALAAVRLAGGDPALQPGDEELLVRPGLGPCSGEGLRGAAAHRAGKRQAGNDRRRNVFPPGVTNGGAVSSCVAQTVLDVGEARHRRERGGSTAIPTTDRRLMSTLNERV